MAGAKAFAERIRREVKAICLEESLNFDVNVDRGTAFQFWCARKIAEHERGFSNSDDSTIVGGPNDLTMDLFLESDSDDRILICQCKFMTGKRRNVDDKDVDDFFSLPKKLKNPEWVAKHASKLVRDVLGDPGRIFANGSNVTLRFITNGDYSTRMRRRFSAQTTRSGPVIEEIWGLTEIKEFVERAESLASRIPDKVTLRLPRDQVLDVDEPEHLQKGGRGIIAILKTNAVAQLYEEHKEAIYAYNIRRNLPKSSINEDMEATLREEPDKFFYFNNGISAICKSFDVDNQGVLTATDFQIINGTQTLHAIWQAPRNSSSRVIFRLTETETIRTESGLPADIIRYNNTQNEVKDSDFRSNDPIQVWLDWRFKQRPWPYSALPNLRYVRKRGGTERAKRGQRSIALEEFAKLRYSWLFDPVTVSRPNVLYSVDEESGKYGHSFGVDTMVVDEWPDEVLEDALLGLWFHWQIKEWSSKLKRRRKDDPEGNVNWLSGHRWHILALAGAVTRAQGVDPGFLLRDASRCEEFFWESFIDYAWEAVEGAEVERATIGQLTLRDWRQSTKDWLALRDEVLRGPKRVDDNRVLREEMSST